MIVHADLRWPEKTGIGAVQSELLKRAPADIEVCNLSVATRIGSSFSTISIATKLSAQRSQNGIFWSPGFIPPAWAKIPVVVTVHDLTHLHYYSKLHAIYYNSVMKRLYRRCSAVICVSDFTRDEFLDWSKLPSSMVTTVHNGVNRQVFFPTQPETFSRSYVFYPGNRRRYKNLDRLLLAYSRSSLPGDGVDLLLTGSEDTQLKAIASKLLISDRMKFTGNVSNQQVAQLYRDARLVAFASLYEGFGLPILEAMASGVPVLTSNISAMPEIAGEAALIVNPRSTEEIMHGLERLHHDEELRRSLIIKGLLQATKFTWDAAATSTWNIVRNTSN